MTFQPVLPLAGLAGWRFLERTYDAQLEAHSNSTVQKNDAAYFAENIGKIDTAEKLVSDRRLLGVSLAAFGLQDDIDNKYFIKTILSGGLVDPDSLANRLTDERYKSLTKAFGFGDLPVARTKLSYFADEILAKFKTESFEVAVGEQNNDFRIALNAKEELDKIATSDAADDTKWFQVMGNPPLRQLFEVALGLPSSFGQIDLDQQLSVFRDKVGAAFDTGEVAQFTADSEMTEKLVQRFLLQSQISQAATPSSGSIALTLLQSASELRR